MFKFSFMAGFLIYQPPNKQQRAYLGIPIRILRTLPKTGRHVSDRSGVKNELCKYLIDVNEDPLVSPVVYVRADT